MQFAVLASDAHALPGSARGASIPASRRPLLRRPLITGWQTLRVSLAWRAAWLALVGLLLALPLRAERIALVIGNSAYASSALPNPVNDARAVADLLQRAGFQVSARYDTRRTELLQTVSQFGQRLRDPKIKLAVFYYAGHGLQLDWRNFLVPVDAAVRTAADVQRQTVDVSELIRYMNEARGRSFVAILDACRDDPFLGAFRPPAKGLSPFDAPSGSLLAYSTAPGKVALDGRGSNSLYTAHLVKELARTDASLEEAFRRVRLNVRIESKGRQIPWESTSLEEEVVLFPRARTKATDANLEQRLEQELSDWRRAVKGNNVNAVSDFIRTYPKGLFSEKAQEALDRLLEDELRKTDATRMEADRKRLAQIEAERIKLEAANRERQAAAERDAARLAAERAEAERLAAAELKALAVAREQAEARKQEQQRQDALREAQARAAAAETRRRKAAEAEAEATRARENEMAQGLAEIIRVASAEQAQRQVVEASPIQTDVPIASTPYFQGLALHRRDYRVGDVYEFRVVDQFSKDAKPLEMRVTAVKDADDQIEFNGGEFVVDRMGNTLRNRVGSMGTPRQFYPAELVVGRKWQTAFKQARPSGTSYTFRYDLKVAAKESITVPAGTFEAFRIEAVGFNVELGAKIERTFWIAPGVNADIAHETIIRQRDRQQIEEYTRQELVRVARR